MKKSELLALVQRSMDENGDGDVVVINLDGQHFEVTTLSTDTPDLHIHIDDEYY